MIKSPRATIDFSPVSITRATHGGQTRVVRISGSRRAVDAWLSLSCGPDYEYRLWKREEKGGRERERERREFVERRHRFTVENVADPRPRI